MLSYQITAHQLSVIIQDQDFIDTFELNRRTWDDGYVKVATDHEPPFIVFKLAMKDGYNGSDKLLDEKNDSNNSEKEILTLVTLSGRIEAIYFVDEKYNEEAIDESYFEYWRNKQIEVVLFGENHDEDKFNASDSRINRYRFRQ